MILRFIICVLLVVLILLFATILVEKIKDLLEEGNYKKMCEQYLSQTGKVLKRIDDLNIFSKRLEKFETDFKAYDKLLENRLTDIESVIKDWKDTMAGAVAYNHGCTECNSGDSKKSHPKTKPKAKSQTDIEKDSLLKKA
ncbi:MAG: hypothetical protein Q4B64_07800 [Spirochaetales bacterium]|nr:hypothetical protein [Spirochaetales bacterium]